MIEKRRSIAPFRESWYPVGMAERTEKREEQRGIRPGQRGGFGQPGRPAEKAKDFKGSMRQFLSYLGPEKAVIIFVCIVAAGASTIAVLAPRILGGATDEIFSGIMLAMNGAGGIAFDRVGAILLQLVAIQSVSILLSYAQGFIMAGVSMRVTYRMREQMSAKIHKLPLQSFDKTTHGDVLSRITNDVDTISNTLHSGISQIIMSAAALVGIIVMMLMISPLLTLVAMIILPMSSIVITAIIKKSQKHFRAQQKSLGSLNGHIEEMFSNHAVVKAFNGERASIEAFDVHNKELYKAGWKAQFLSGLSMPIVGIISNFGYVAVVFTGGLLAMGGAITIGGIQAFIQYTRQFGWPVAQLAGAAGMLQQTAAAAERVFAFLNEKEEPAEARKDGPAARAQGQVTFEAARFGYDPEAPVIKNFSARVEPGQKIAIVGRTGAGKTTIVKLLMRFYDLDSGKILLDGMDARSYARDDLRSHFGMVLQDTWLFSGSIADNIRYGKLGASDEEVVNAAKSAQADHFIRVMPDGYQMTINEEADNISAGQKQLLTIARTILADPDILILDEATSNVDTRTEVLIQRAMDNLMKGRTSFVIAHRLSTIRSADLILVMENGDIIEQGAHEQLLAKGGAYATLYNSQFDVDSNA